MTFIVSKLLWLLLRPSALLLLIGLAGLLIAWWQWVGARRRDEGPGLFGMVLITLSLGSYGLLLALPLNEYVLRPLEERFPPVTDPPAEVAGIIVLGGSIGRELSVEHGMPSMNDTAERMTTFVALARRYPQARLVFTGGKGTLTDAPPEAVAAKQLFDSLGLADRHVIYEDQSHNTVQNAQYSHALVQPKPGELWILVTSAAHMPRSVGIFRKDGWNVLPWPVGYKTGHGLDLIFSDALPDRLAQVDWGAHEWVGMVAYWLLGRTDALFPGPLPPSPAS